uniref:Uncharacterized protein n=1 Tax=Bursaphelenchus xylophilus TaxID=6326 RepID=A0A1I7SQA9_BURXY
MSENSIYPQKPPKFTCVCTCNDQMDEMSDGLEAVFSRIPSKSIKPSGAERKDTFYSFNNVLAIPQPNKELKAQLSGFREYMAGGHGKGETEKRAPFYPQGRSPSLKTI